MNPEFTFTDFSENKLSTFYFSFLFLPKQKRDAINIVYNWCRATDDIVDSNLSTKNKETKLLLWAKEFEKAISGKSDYQVLNKLGKIINEFQIPIEHFRELISGMELDVNKNSYENFDELLDYCYKAASTVGLICAEIFGYNKKETLEYSKTLGFALQLTNILRDVKIDLQKNNRIYIPNEDFLKFNYSKNDLKNNIYNDNFVELMKFEVNRTKEFFYKTKKLLSNEDKPLFIAAEIMSEFYFEILQKIEKCDYNIFENDIRLKSFKKISIGFDVWLKMKKNGK